MTRQTTRILIATFCLASLAIIYLGTEMISATDESAPLDSLPTATPDLVGTRRAGQSFPVELESEAEHAEPSRPKDLADVIVQMRQALHRGGAFADVGPYEFYNPFRKLDTAQLREAVEIVRKTMATDIYRHEFDVILMSLWAAKDGAAAMAHLMEHRNVLPEHIINDWSGADLDGPWQWYLAKGKKDAEDHGIRSLAGMILGAMVAKDPDKAFARLQTLQGHERSHAIEQISLSLRTEARNHSVGHPSAQGDEYVDRTRALRHAESLPSELREVVRKSILSFWASDDREAAVAWVRSRPSEEMDVFRLVIEKGLIGGGFPGVGLLLEITPQHDKPRAYATIAKEWHVADLRDAMDWAKLIPEEDQRAIAVQTIYDRYKEKLGVSAADAILAAPARTAEQCARDKLPPPLPTE